MGSSAFCHCHPFGKLRAGSEQSEGPPKNERKQRFFTALRSVQNDRIAFSYTFIVFDLLQRPGAAHRAREPTVGWGIIDETFNFRVPLEFLLKPYGNVADMADYVRLHSYIDGT